MPAPDLMPVVMLSASGTGWPPGELIGFDLPIGTNLWISRAQGWEFPRLVRSVDAMGNITVLEGPSLHAARRDPPAA